MKKNLLVITLIIILSLCLSSAVFSAEKIELKVWVGSWWSDNAPLIVEEFEKTYPQYKLELDTLPIKGYFDNATTAILAGSPPDVLALDIGVLSTFAAKDLITDLTADVGEKLNEADFLRAVWKNSLYKGKNYGVPCRSTGNVVYYNKSMFDDAGVEYPKMDWTFEDLLDKAKKITIPGEKYGFSISVDMSDMGSAQNSFLPWIWGFGGNVLNEDRTKSMMDQPNAIEGLTQLTELYTKHKVVPEGSMGMTTSRDAIPLFVANKLAMFTLSGNAIAILNEYPDLKWDIVQWPGGNGKAGGWSLTVPVNAEHKKGAIDFMLWYANPEVQGKFNNREPGNIHAWKVGERWSSPAYLKCLEASTNGRAIPPIGNWTEIQNILIKEWQKALLEEKTPEQAAKDMTQQINLLLE